MISVYLGYDHRETVSYHVGTQSILSRSSKPVTVAPLMLSQLEGIFTRDKDAKQTTDFSFTRFLVPYLNNYEGWSLFMDCDILMLDDIAKLWELRDDKYAVMCVKHDHQPKETVKFLGQVQSSYPKKNWSSVMLFNNAKCKALTPDYVNTASGLDLHRFNWLENEDLVGAIPPRWNHLVDYQEAEPIENLSNLHYTIGGPWFEDFKNCGYSEPWWKELDATVLPLKGKLTH
jgi:lipopolysaccharide biosynthesis glycosyltransferase